MIASLGTGWLVIFLYFSLSRAQPRWLSLRDSQELSRTGTGSRSSSRPRLPGQNKSISGVDASTAWSWWRPRMDLAERGCRIYPLFVSAQGSQTTRTTIKDRRDGLRMHHEASQSRRNSTLLGHHTDQMQQQPETSRLRTLIERNCPRRSCRANLRARADWPTPEQGNGHPKHAKPALLFPIQKAIQLM